MDGFFHWIKGQNMLVFQKKMDISGCFSMMGIAEIYGLMNLTSGCFIEHPVGVWLLKMKLSTAKLTVTDLGVKENNMAKYGIPYKGSKNKIADDIIR